MVRDGFCLHRIERPFSFTFLAFKAILICWQFFFSSVLSYQFIHGLSCTKPVSPSEYLQLHVPSLLHGEEQPLIPNFSLFSELDEWFLHVGSLLLRIPVASCSSFICLRPNHQLRKPGLACCGYLFCIFNQGNCNSLSSCLFYPSTPPTPPPQDRPWSHSSC